jgi:hypothetical protein
MVFELTLFPVSIIVAVLGEDKNITPTEALSIIFCLTVLKELVPEEAVAN